MILNKTTLHNRATTLAMGALLCLPLFLDSCSKDDDTVTNPEDEVVSQVIVDKSGASQINYGKIVIGLSDNDITFRRNTTILDQRGRVVEVVRDCCGMAAIKLNGEEKDTLTRIDNVTLINRGTIEIHTKNFVEKYRDLTQLTRDDTTNDRPYHYIRVIGMLAEGEGDMLINEGTIDVYFDHDPTVDFKVYCFAICGNAHSTFINRGQIRFHGKGGEQVRMRGMGTMANYVTSINEGTMSCDVEIAEDTRFITTGGDYNDIINNGVMEGKTTGRLIGMTRFGNSNIVNNGTINLTSVKTPEGYSIYLPATDRFTCGLMESVSASRVNIPPMNNRGDINVTIESADGPAAVGHGIFFDMVAPNNASITINNEGSIKVSQSDAANKHDMAEVAFVDRSGKNGACNIKVGRWKTALRDFKTTKDLFFAKGISMDFSGAEFLFTKGDKYVDGTTYGIAAEDLICNGAPESSIFEYKGYDNALFSSASSDYTINWDKSSKTASLSGK